MAKKDDAAEQLHSDRCENCGACKHCGSGGRQQFIPYPYPVYPWTVQPYRPYYVGTPNPYVTYPQTTWSNGSSVNQTSGGPRTQTYNG